MLLKNFKDHLVTLGLENTKPCLLGVSGGMDSMVMAKLFVESKIPVIIAHVNYQLRDKDSNLDEELVRGFCMKHNLPFELKTTNFKPEIHKNLQVWARKERFEFFQALCDKYQINQVGLAHHKSDQLETIVLSMLKGYDPQSMEERTIFENITLIRPLLGTDREVIKEFAEVNKVPFRLDKSNLDSKYDRNFVRLDLLPVMMDRFKDLSKRMTGFAERQKKNKKLLEGLMNLHLMEHITSEKNDLEDLVCERISLNILKDDIGLATLVYFLGKQGFSEEQVNDLATTKNKEARFLTKELIALNDGENICLARQSAFKEKVLEKEDIDHCEYKNGLKFSFTDHSPENSTKLRVNIDALEFPLNLRVMNDGEEFQPFGLKGHTKKVGKFLKEKGMSWLQQRSKLLLADQKGQIIIPGIEIDYRLRQTEFQEKCLFIYYEDKRSSN